jgi:hypothetical protein
MTMMVKMKQMTTLHKPMGMHMTSHIISLSYYFLTRLFSLLLSAAIGCYRLLLTAAVKELPS